MYARSLAALCTLGLLLSSCGPVRLVAASPSPGVERIGHVIVVYLENRSFDGLYGSFPGANGLPQAAAIAPQLDKVGNPYAALPRAMDNSKTPAVADARFAKDGDLTPDGFVVNTTYTVNASHPKTTAAADLLPSLTNPTIGDRLTAKGVDWAWYSGGWDEAIAGRPDPTFVFHHQPFAYFASYADGTDGRRQHLKDERDFMSALRDRTLPAVSFVKPIGADSGHPKYGDVKHGEDHVAALVKAVQESDYWKDTVIVLTYDENGGFWDHVAPPTIDRWGPGTRVPTIVVSPFAKKGYVDHTRYDTTSILRLIELRWNLDPLGPRDTAADPLTGAFGF